MDYTKLEEYLNGDERRKIYGEEEKGLFWLGYLTARIGHVQLGKGGRKKSILNKLNLEGMNLHQLKNYYNQIFEQLEIYNLLSKDNEKSYAESKILFEKHLNDWKLSIQENVFYILSGYALTTKLLLEKEDENG